MSGGAVSAARRKYAHVVTCSELQSKLEKQMNFRKSIGVEVPVKAPQK